MSQGRGDRPIFPPHVIVEVKALACERLKDSGLPLSRLSHADIARQATARGLVASISGATVWRWLNADAIKPWFQRSWIFPRDPRFAEKAGVVVDLYQRLWEGEPLGPNDFVVSADEKTSIQARRRIHPDSPPAPGRNRRVEFEYERAGALAYVAAWDVHRAKVFGLCEQTTGIEAYHRLVDLVMRQEPYASARRVFWITDNGSSHRGAPSVQRLSQWYSNAVQIHTPVHASWLNQIEIYFSVVQRKVLTPNDFEDVGEVEKRPMEFQTHYMHIAKPFQWEFTREKLQRLVTRLSEVDLPLAAAAWEKQIRDCIYDRSTKRWAMASLASGYVFAPSPAFDAGVNLSTLIAHPLVGLWVSIEAQACRR